MATLERSNKISISQLLSEEVIDADLEVTGRKEVCEELVNLLADTGKVKDSSEALEAVMEREGYMSTGIGNGVAIPHAKSSSVDSLVAAFGRIKDGVDFKAIDGKPVFLVFLLLTPEKEAGLHVRALARISRLLKNLDFKNRLIEMETANQIIEAVREQEGQQ